MGFLSTNLRLFLACVLLSVVSPLSIQPTYTAEEEDKSSKREEQDKPLKRKGDERDEKQQEEKKKEKETSRFNQMEVTDMSLNSAEGYQTFDCSYEPIIEERFTNIPYGAIREALFSQNIENAESLLSPMMLEEFIRQQPNLTKLHLDENLLRDEGITPLSTLTSLIDLNIADNGITNVSLKNIISPITTLRSLDLSGNYFNIDGLRTLGQVATHLQNLSCNFVPLGDAGAEFIVQNARQLQTLGFRGTGLSDKGLMLFTSLNYLKKIDISYNTISSICLSDFIQKMNSRNVEVIADYINHQ